VPAPEIDDRLKIVSSNIFTKTEGDAFTVDSLNMYLTSCNAKEIVLVGLMAEKCIYATALGGLKKGYDMYIVPEAVIGQTPEKKATAIEKMTKKGIRLLSMDEVK
jgi:nicotinamidase-related amidase